MEYQGLNFREAFTQLTREFEERMKAVFGENYSSVPIDFSTWTEQNYNAVDSFCIDFKETAQIDLGYPLGLFKCEGQSANGKQCNAMVIFGLFCAIIEKNRLSIQRMNLAHEIDQAARQNAQQNRSQTPVVKHENKKKRTK